MPGKIDPRPTLRDRSEFRDESVRLTDLVGDYGFAIEGKTFVRCAILGPAVIHPYAPTPALANHFQTLSMAHHQSAMFICIPLGLPMVGGIAIMRCKFVDCHFDRVQLIGIRDHMMPLAVAFERTEPRSQWALRVDYRGPALPDSMP